MKEVLIINLTRMGDLIQTTPVIQGLKEKYRDLRITLLASSSFASICKHLPLIDRVIIFDIKKVIDLVTGGRIIEGYRYVEEILDTINDTRYDLAVNFTHSADSAVLTSLINTKEVRGISMDAEGYSVKRHPWIRYFFNVIPSREFNPFHLCDMHLKVCEVSPVKKGLHLNVPDEAMHWINELLVRKRYNSNGPVIALQLGASAEDKRWPVASFAALADLLQKELGATIILTGARNETEYGVEFERLSRAEIINLIGKTDLSQLSATLKGCDLLISNDTGPLHIGTAVGTTVVNISLASVHFRETGPYGEGHYVIVPEIACYPCNFRSDCKTTLCKKTISPETVLKLVKLIFSKNEIDSLAQAPEWEQVQIFKSFFDSNGLIEYMPLIKNRPIHKATLFTHIYRETWLKILDNNRSIDYENLYLKVLNKLTTWYDIQTLRKILSEIEETEALERLEKFADSLLSILDVITREIRKPDHNIELIKTLWKSVPPIDEELEKLGCLYPSIKPIIILYKYEKESLEGSSEVEILTDAKRMYRNIKEHAAVLRQILLKLRAWSAIEGKKPLTQQAIL